jgi:thioesterase domain-containing protein
MRVQAIRLQRRGLGYLAEWARRRARWERERWTARFSSGEPDREPEEEFHNTAIERAFRAALPRYEMRPYPGHVQLFRPALDSRYILGPGRVLNEERRWVFEDNGWGQWVDSIEVVEMPGDHDSMVLEPNVRVMAARVRERFESL